MGRHSEGFKIRQRAPGLICTVRFTHGGRGYELSTGTTDRQAAQTEGARIYAEQIAQEPEPPRQRRSAREKPFEELVAAWLIALEGTLDPGTLRTLEMYASAHWLPFFGALSRVTDASCADYQRARLRVVKAVTVRKELSGLRMFLSWCRERGELERSVTVPGVPKRALGTPYAVRRKSKAVTISPNEVERLIAKLPEWSRSRKVERFPVRARFVIAYETSLRPSTLDALSVPEHYRRGATGLQLTPEIDKNRMDRFVPLTRRAREVLDAICPTQGLIFGKHDYRPHVKAAARRVLGKDRGERFAGSHLRSAALTHWLELPTANLPAVQHMAGHKHTSTTAIYVRATSRAARSMLREVDRLRRRSG